MSLPARHGVLLKRMLIACAASFVFCFSLIPIYTIYCEITGINGKTGTLSAASASQKTVDRTRTVKVEFDAAVKAGLNWEFRPKVASVNVHPGEVTEVLFEAINREPEAIVGQAVPSVAPNRASLYFSKTECFCFTEQPLQAGESKDMPVRFVIDPELPHNVSTVTLSYVFYRSDHATQRLAQSAATADNHVL